MVVVQNGTCNEIAIQAAKHCTKESILQTLTRRLRGKPRKGYGMITEIHQRRENKGADPKNGTAGFIQVADEGNIFFQE